MSKVGKNMRIVKPGNFQIRFDNGYALSIGIDTFHYCDARNRGPKAKLPSQVMAHANTCEIAVIDPQDGLMSISPYDQVIGWVTPNQVALAIAIVSDKNFKEFKPITKFEETIKGPA